MYCIEVVYKSCKREMYNVGHIEYSIGEKEYSISGSSIPSTKLPLTTTLYFYTDDCVICINGDDISHIVIYTQHSSV